MIEIHCDCGRSITVPPAHIGKLAACPACKQPLRVIAPGHGVDDGDPDGALVVVTGPHDRGEHIFLGGPGPIRVGKLPDRDIRLRGEKVSRKHCRLIRTESGWRVEDDGSTNGVTVNGTRAYVHDLRDGDTVRIGEYQLRFVALHPSRPAASPSTPTPRATTPPPATQSPKQDTEDAPLPLADEDDDLFELAALEEVAPAAPSVPLPAPGARPVCPSCNRMLGPGAKICVACGIDLKTRRPILTAHEPDIDEIYVRAEGLIRVISWLFYFGVFPVASEAFGTHKPYVIRMLALLTVLSSVSFWAYGCSPAANAVTLGNLMLWTGRDAPPPEVDADARADGDFDFDPALPSGVPSGIGYRTSQLITHAFLHADPVHLAGNLLFLLVLGSRVNALVGNIGTLFLYPLLAVVAALAHMQATAHQPPHALLGASGAVMGLAGMYLVFFPVHKMHMAAWFRFGLFWGFRLSLRIFAVRGFWVVLFYIAFDVFYTAMGIEDGVAHWAHLGGFLAGAGIALVLLLAGLVDCRGGDLISTILGRPVWTARR